MSKIKWQSDPVHSQIQFSIRHMVISKIRGEFKQFEASAETEGENMDGALINFQAAVDSIDTGNAYRDKDLKTDESLFHSEKHPRIIFTSTGFKKKDEVNYLLKGNLTIRDITRPVELKVEHGGIITDPFGARRAGFSVTGKINRKDFGMNYNNLIETGGAVVGEEVNLDIHIEFTRQQ
ncbi:MAG: YceI family protein [Bacteroidia bacterium]|nr:YceI family protein [Bacteroidia bacterium]MCZ2278359.1 YceI family protein [Bacteroidia bacterium]